MKRNLLIGLFIFLAIAFIALTIFGIVIVRQNTDFLNFNIRPDDIKQNNTNMVSREEDSNDRSEIDLINLVEKDLIVPEELATTGNIKNRKLYLPENFEINVYASGLNNPRFMVFDESDNLYVTDKNGGRILILKDLDKNGIVEEVTTIGGSLNTPHGIDLYEGDLYIAEENQIVVYRDITPQGEFSNKEILVNELPSGGGHSTRTVMIGPDENGDEKMYVSIGSSCNVCEEDDPRRASIMRYELDGSNEEIFAEGLRNTVGFDFAADGRLWGADHGRDRIGDDIPPEEVNIIEGGKHYGWPYCYGNQVANPEYPDRTDFCKNQTTAPAYEMQAHSAPLGFTFIPNDTNLPDELDNNAFIGFHGSWNRTTPTGYKVVRINTEDIGSEPINFVTGWLGEDGQDWGRPVDVQFDSQGNIYISDDSAGVIYRVTYTL